MELTKVYVVQADNHEAYEDCCHWKAWRCCPFYWIEVLEVKG